MTKHIDIARLTIGSIGTQYKWYAPGSPEEILNNTSQTDIRLDKVMMQFSGQTDATGPVVAGVIVHLADETGASLHGSISNGVTTDATLETLLNQWKDNVFMTDFRMIGTGGDESVQPVIPMEADTRRILKPGQKLYVTIIVQPLTTETSKTLTLYMDSMIWYSAAAQ